MADTSIIEWPKGSWVILKKMIRAWYAAEESSDVTQKKVAKLAGLQESVVSLNKPFLQGLGIIESGGSILTNAGRNYALGLYKENERVQKQGLQKVVTGCLLLKQLLDVIRGRGQIEQDDFEAELTLITKQGSSTKGFMLGMSVLLEILRESALIEISGGTLRPVHDVNLEEEKTIPKGETSLMPEKARETGLRRIPIPVSASTIWWVEVNENPNEGEIEKFIEMQRLIFTKK